MPFLSAVILKAGLCNKNVKSDVSCFNLSSHRLYSASWSFWQTSCTLSKSKCRLILGKCSYTVLVEHALRNVYLHFFRLPWYLWQVPEILHPCQLLNEFSIVFYHHRFQLSFRLSFHFKFFESVTTVSEKLDVSILSKLKIMNQTNIRVNRYQVFLLTVFNILGGYRNKQDQSVMLQLES